MAESTQGSRQTLRAPDAGQSVVVVAVPGQDIVLDSAFDQAEPKVSDNTVVFEFAGGGQVVIDFSELGDAQAPNIVMPDGTVLNVQEFLASLGEGDVEPAAGPEGGGTGSGGVGEYRDDAGNLIDGVDKLGGLDPRDFSSITVEGLEADNALPSAGIVDGAADEDGLRISEMTPFDGNDDERGGDHPAQFAYVEGVLSYDFGGDGPAGTDPFMWSLAGLAAKGVTSEGNTLLYEVVDGVTLNAYYMGMPDYPDYPTDDDGPSIQVAEVQDVPLVKILVFSLEVTDLDTGAFRFELYRPLDHTDPGSEDDIVYNFTFTLTDGSGDSVVGGLNMIVDDDSPIWKAGEANVSALVVEETMSYDDGDLSEGNGEGLSTSAQMPSSSSGDQGTIESFLGIAAGGLSPLAASGTGYDDATNGSAMKTTIMVEAGDEISFSWFFNADDYTPYNDFSFVSFNGQPFELADISMVGSYNETPWATYTFTATVDGPLTLGFGVMNTGDSGVNSYLSIDNIKVNGVTVPNGGFENGNFANWDILGDPALISNALYSDEASGLAGSLAELISFGADGPGEFSMLTDTSELPTLFSKGEAVQYVVEGNTLIAYVGEYPSGSGEEVYSVSMIDDGGYRVVFTLQINPDGSWSFDLQDQLDHVDDGTDSQNFDLITGEDGESVTSVSAIDFSSLIKVTDGDGDELAGAPAGAFTIQVQDDVPVAIGQPLAVTVDEDDIKTWLSLGNHPNDGNADGSYTGNQYFSGPGPANVSGSLASLVSFGADEPGGFSLATDLSGLEEQGLFSKGEELSYRVEGSTLIAFVGEDMDGDFQVASMDYMPAERIVFTLNLDADGSYTFNLFDQLDHPAGEGQNNLPIDLSSAIVATDADGDSITLSSGFTVNVTDDVPEVVGKKITAIVDEDDIDTPWSEGTNPDDGNADGSLTGGPGDPWNVQPAYVSGSLAAVVSFGADDKGSFDFTDNVLATMASLHLYSKQSALPENGLQLTYALNHTGGFAILTAFEPDTPGPGNTGNPVFELRLNQDTGDYEFRLYDELIHVAPKSGADENFMLRSGPEGQISSINFGAVIEAVDKDGDAVTLNGKFEVKVRDDVPEVDVDLTWSGSVLHDESAGLQNDDTHSYSTALRFASVANPGDDPHVSGTGAIGYARSGSAIVSVDWGDTETGADSPALASGYSLVLLNAYSGLKTTEGASITLSVDGAGRIIGTVASGVNAGKTAFAIAIDGDDGEVFVAQYLSLKHPDPKDHDEQVDLAGKIAVRYSITDSDGDTVFDQKEMGARVAFDDDGPSMVVGAIAEGGITLTTDDAATIGEAFDTASASFSAAMQAAVTPLYGADGPGGLMVGGYSLSINGGNGADSGLNSNGLDILLSKEGGDVVGRTTAGEVFRLSVDSNGLVQLKQSAEVDHLEGTASDDLISLANNKVFLNATATVTDGDNDTASNQFSVDLGGNIRFADDVPDAKDDAVSAVENWTGAKTYNLLLIVDRSGSISQSEMQAAVAAMNSLLDKYAEVAKGGEAGVQVQVVTFAVDGTLVHGSPVSIAQAKAYLDILDNSGGSGNTNYDAAVAAATPAINDWPIATADHDNVVYFISDGAPTVGNGTVGLTNAEEAAWETTLMNRGATAWAIGVGTNDAVDDDLADVAYPDTNVLLASNFNDSLLDALIGTVPVPTTIEGNVLDNDASGADGWNSPALVSASYGADTHVFASPVDSHTFDLGLVGSVLMKGDGSYVFTPGADVQDDIFADLSYTVRDGDGDEDTATLRLTTTDLSEVTAVADTVTVIPGEDPVQWGGAEFVVVDDEGAGGQDRWDVSSDLFTADAGEVISLDLNLSNYRSPYWSGGNWRQDAVEIGLLDTAGNEVATITMRYWDGYWAKSGGSAGTVAFSYGGGTTTAHVTFNSVALDGTYKISVNVNDGTGGSEKLTVKASGLVVGTGTDPVYWPSVGMAAMALPITGNLFANDALGAEGASIMAVAVSGLGTFTDGDSDGVIVATGNYGTMTVNTLTGVYEYTPNATGSVPDIGDTDVFTYTLAQADGDSSTADLTINFAASVGETGTAASETLVLSTDAGGSMSGLGGNDHLIGGDGDDILSGDDGSDVLEGGLGNDLLSGGAGSDFLSGGAGNDTLVGGAGDDVMTGGAGQDVFRYVAGDLDGVIDGDTITDFELGAGGDTLDLAALLNGATSGTLDQYLDFTVSNIAGGAATVEINVDPAGTGNHATTLATITVTGVGVGDTADTIIDTMINHNIDI